MLRATLRGLLERKTRTAMSAFAVVLGVAMVSGTYVLTDTLDEAFGGIFESSYGETAAVVTGKQVVENSNSGSPTVPEGLIERIERLRGVKDASGQIFDLDSTSNSTDLIGEDGEPLAGENAEGIAFGMVPGENESTPFTLAEGDWASGPTEIAIDQATADDNGLGVGESVSVVSRLPTREMIVSGIVEFGELSSLGGATLSVFDLPVAQRLVGKEGQLDQIAVQAVADYPAAALVGDIDDRLPRQYEVNSGSQQAETDAEDSEEALDTVRTFLLAFAGIALFVGAFVIFNTLSMTIAQRVRELATLRTLGALRRQILTSVLIEGLVIGALASAVGVGLGLLLSQALTELFSTLGGELPEAPTVFAGRTVLVSMALGISITVVASVFPALRATRVPPIAAVREGATLPRTVVSRRAVLISALLTVAGVGLWVLGISGERGIEQRLILVGAGAAALFAAVIVIAGRIAGPMADAIGAPIRRFGGVPGDLGVHNAGRNPARTARTATALMIGIALVTLVAALGTGLRGAIRGALEDQVLADYVISSAGQGGEGVPVEVERRLTKLGATATGIRSDRAEVDGAEVEVSGVDPRGLTGTFALYGSDDEEPVLALRGGGAILDRDFADDHGLAVGEIFEMTVPSGEEVSLVVTGFEDPPAVAQLNPLIGKVIVTQAVFDEAFDRLSNELVLVNLDATPAALAAGALERNAEQLRGLDVAPREDWIDEEVDTINTLLNLLYVLLGLSVVVSLFGMLNALALSVFERTREIGMLRAVGLDRRQLRRMVRGESVVIALIGAATGIALGLLLAVMISSALSDEGVSFAVPFAELIAFTVAAAIAGVLAAILPARRAGRIDILEALQYE